MEVGAIKSYTICNIKTTAGEFDDPDAKPIIWRTIPSACQKLRSQTKWSFVFLSIAAGQGNGERLGSPAGSGGGDDALLIAPNVVAFKNVGYDEDQMFRGTVSSI